MPAVDLADDAPVDPDDERLVAYLDGELERSERAELESRLMEEESLRIRLQQLQTGWEMLAEIEGPATSSKLVESTLELVVADIVQPTTLGTASWFVRHRWSLGILVACLIGVGTTLLAASVVKSRQYNRQLKELAIVEDLDAYLYGSDLELMRQLAADKEWRQMIDASREVGKTTDPNAETITSVSTTPLAEREAMIAELPLEKRAELTSRWERFKRLDLTVRDRIRNTADTVANQTDAADLLQTMNAYALWREIIPSTELRDNIESKDPAVRQQAIALAKQQTQRQIAERSSYMLDEETVERLYYVLREIVQERVEHGDEAIKRGFEQIKKLAGDRDPIDTALAITVLRSEWFGANPPDPLSASELNWIRLVLPDQAAESLEMITGGIPLLESSTLRIWAEEAVRRRYRPQKTDTTLERYQSLDPADRDVLDLLPPKEILKNLTE